jgi:polar amino acid transport system substrate-binding protein
MNRLRMWRGLLVALPLVAVAPASSAARADVLDEIRQSETLLWGGDQEGGGPFVFIRDDRPAEIIGFEVELAGRLAEYLKVRAMFIQGQWDKMPDMLRAGKVHVILNGYELTSERLAAMDASIPYYIYELQLLARKSDASLNTWDDLKKRPRGAPLKIGALTASAADTYATEFCGEACEVVRYDGSTDAMREVETGKIDATLQDTPIASFYAPRFPGLKPVGAPVAPGYYVAYFKKGEAALARAINEAIALMLRNGEIERIYRKYGIWNDRQRDLMTIVENGRFYGYSHLLDAKVDEPAAPNAEDIAVGERRRGWEVVENYAGILIRSAGMTVVLSCLSFPLAITAGLLIAIGRLYGPAIVRAPLTWYVEFLRGTPLMLQLYFVFFFLPEIGIAIPAFWTAILGLAINYSAYESEIYRAGLQAVPPGQMEAALSLGMSRPMAIRRIVAPQAVRMVIPPVVNDFIALFKDTSVCSVVTIVELTKRFSILSMSTQATIELMLMTAFLYLAMSYPLSLVSRRVEKRLGVGVAA